MSSILVEPADGARAARVTAAASRWESTRAGSWWPRPRRRDPTRRSRRESRRREPVFDCARERCPQQGERGEHTCAFYFRRWMAIRMPRSSSAPELPAVTTRPPASTQPVPSVAVRVSFGADGLRHHVLGAPRGERQAACCSRRDRRDRGHCVLAEVAATGASPPPVVRGPTRSGDAVDRSRGDGRRMRSTRVSYRVVAGAPRFPNVMAPSGLPWTHHFSRFAPGTLADAAHYPKYRMTAEVAQRVCARELEVVPYRGWSGTHTGAKSWPEPWRRTGTRRPRRRRRRARSGSACRRGRVDRRSVVVRRRFEAVVVRADRHGVRIVADGDLHALPRAALYPSSSPSAFSPSASRPRPVEVSEDMACPGSCVGGSNRWLESAPRFHFDDRTSRPIGWRKTSRNAAPGDRPQRGEGTRYWLSNPGTAVGRPRTSAAQASRRCAMAPTRERLVDGERRDGAPAIDVRASARLRARPRPRRPAAGRCGAVRARGRLLGCPPEAAVVIRDPLRASGLARCLPSTTAARLSKSACAARRAVVVAPASAGPSCATATVSSFCSRWRCSPWMLAGLHAGSRDRSRRTGARPTVILPRGRPAPRRDGPCTGQRAAAAHAATFPASRRIDGYHRGANRSFVMARDG